MSRRGGGAGTTGTSQAEVYGMRRKNAISRFAALVFATLACLLLAVLAPMFFGQRATDEPFSGYAVMASPRDMHVIAAPIRLRTCSRRFLLWCSRTANRDMRS